MPQPVEITIYTTSTCPYCARAKALLRERGLEFEEISVDGDPAERAAMTARANGRRTVPQIFFGAAHVGGCDDLHALDARGELAQGFWLTRRDDQIRPEMRRRP